MNEKDIIYLIKVKKATILTIVLVFVVLGVAFSLTQGLRYSSSLRLLVVQKSGITADSYAMSKSNEYLGQLLSKVAYSNTFFNKVIENDPSINRDYFGFEAKDKVKKWERAIDVRNVRETGIISIKAYHTDRGQAERLARSLALTIMTQHGNYHGLGDSVMIRLLDEPITSDYPNQPNLLVNFLGSMLAGFAFAIAWLYLRNDSITPNKTVREADHNDKHDFYQNGYQAEDLVANGDAELDAKYPWQNYN